jgi:uncharacterized membrane protein
MFQFFAFICVFIILYYFYKRSKRLEKKIKDLDLHFQILKRRLEDVEKSKHHVLEDVLMEKKETGKNFPADSPDVEHRETILQRLFFRSLEKVRSSITQKAPLASKKTEPKRQSRTRTEWELLIGGKWLNWIGAVALFLGTAFFMKYAFDNNWINEVTRVVIGIVFGVILLFLGKRFASKGLALFSQGLVGAGIGVLYTSVFASYNFYSFVPQVVAITLMLFVTIISFQQALYYQSLPIAIIGWLGAYGTPFLFPGEGSTIGLMSYLGFVTVGMSALVWKKQRWSIFYYLSFLATYLIFFGWSLASSSNENSVFLAFLSFFWLLFYMFDLRFLFREKATKYEKVFGVLNTLFLTIGLIWHLPHIANYRGLLSVCMIFIAVVYLIPIVIFRFNEMLSKTNNWQTARQSITFLVFVLIATALYFDFKIFLFVVSIELGIMIWWGLRYQVRYIERFALSVISCTTLGILVYTVSEAGQSKPIFNWVLWDDLIGVVVLLWCAHLYQAKSFTSIRNSLHAMWSILLAVGIYVESYLLFLHVYPREMYVKLEKWDFISHVSYITDLGVAFCLLVYAVLLGWFGLKRQVNTVLIISNTILFIMTIQLVTIGRTYLTIEYFRPVWNIRCFVFLLTIVLLFGSYQLWKKFGEQYSWYKWYRLSVILTIVVLLFELVTVEIIDGFTKQINFLEPTSELNRVSYLENLEFYTLVLVWILGSIPMYILGVRLRYRLLMYLALSTLGLGAVPILFRGFTFYSYEHFVPVINLRFLSFVCVIGVFFFFYQYMKQKQDMKKSLYLSYIRQTLFFLSVSAVFLIVTLEINDTFEATMLRLVAEREEVIQLRNLQQLSISIAWLLLSCLFLWIGIWQKKQSVRILSICVFGLSILKIFLFDLSFLTMLYRIFSFMGLGIILLAVSFIYQKYKHWFSAN